MASLIDDEDAIQNDSDLELTAECNALYKECRADVLRRVCDDSCGVKMVRQ
ncbi:MAG: hypothetical protein ACXV5H_00870 [Halobacteriota archaeon]